MSTKKILLFAVLFSLCNYAFSQVKGDEDKEMFNNAKQRDQKMIDEAVNGWWKQSMTTHDQRVQWWRDAKFGMFIHWGVYSLPGGEWKGKKVGGYAEHLMRKEQIKRAEYLQLAHQFNPVNFNAEEWIKHALDAGMKYFIITAKHHDGFALFDSKASDFNIVQQTPFKRDPMAELAAAAKRFGMKFGFYYSHAFDWEHPDAPGNDWDYNNPGGDKLLGGANWFDNHPEWLPKAIKYVDEKSIPQIKELITKYHPDILWFDTPHKLPLSENIKILKAIREADPNVVVNGRLARSSGYSFGDYRNTADRPAEFYPVQGDWEAIPTTNESYGYSKFDHSHKSVSHFVRLLANSASRGGNLLMNIGPKGDGNFDQKDLDILNGIGAWLKKNGESIYGSTASSLPLQSWGVSTLKNNKLYLHILDWPKDGKLLVGGLKNKIDKAVLLSAPSKNFAAKSINGSDLLIELPKTAIDTVNTVLVLTLNGGLQTDAVRYVQTNIKETRLLAYDATQHGKGFGFGDGKTDRYYVDGWKNKEQSLSWDFKTTTASDFKIDIKYLAAKQSAGGSFALQIDDFYTSYLIEPGSSATVPVTKYLTNISLSPGLHKIKLTPINIKGDELMKLLEIDLQPVSPAPISLSKIFGDAEKQTKVMLSEVPKAKSAGSSAKDATPGSAGTDLVSPRTLDAVGNLRLVTSRDWTSAFFPGVLWYLNEFTGKPEWKEEARKFTANIEKEKTNATTHDMGFKVYCSFGNGYRLTKDPHYREVIIQSAKTLAKRFNPIAGVIRSWDHNRQKWDYPVIIDNMMNLELLFEAAKLSGDKSLYKIAVSHADNTMKNHFRKDFSSWHVVDYDSTKTGGINKKTTHQGYSNESVWARGQAWALYGYTLCYRETKDPKYLKMADNIANYILKHPNLPKDLVPYWDFDAPNIPDEPRDASAAAIIASALYELSTYNKSKGYKNIADTIVKNLTNYYRAPIGGAKGFILLHSTGSKPSDSEVDVPLNYADYYYLEALLRMKRLNENKKLF